MSTEISRVTRRAETNVIDDYWRTRGKNKNKKLKKKTRKYNIVPYNPTCVRVSQCYYLCVVYRRTWRGGGQSPSCCIVVQQQSRVLSIFCGTLCIRDARSRKTTRRVLIKAPRNVNYYTRARTTTGRLLYNNLRFVRAGKCFVIICARRISKQASKTILRYTRHADGPSSWRVARSR